MTAPSLVLASTRALQHFQSYNEDAAATALDFARL